MKNLLITAVLAIAAVSCKTAGTAATTPPQKPVDVAAPVKNSTFINTITQPSQFNTLKISSKVDVQTGSYLPTADAVIYIENGGKVWMNISAAFLNVARGIATPSGVKGYEKISKTYIDSDFEYLNRLMNVNFVNFSTLQNLLVGKTFLPVNPEDFTLTQNAQGYTLISSKNQKITVDGRTNEYKTSFSYSPQYDLTQVVTQDVKTLDRFEVSYSNWINVGEERFPKNVKIIIKGQQNSQILIENTKFEFLKMETPYSVPNNYKKKEF